MEVRAVLLGCNPACELRTFTEQVPAVALAAPAPEPLLRSLLEAFGLHLAGRAGARLALVLLAIAVSSPDKR